MKEYLRGFYDRETFKRKIILVMQVMKGLQNIYSLLNSIVQTFLVSRRLSAILLRSKFVTKRTLALNMALFPILDVYRDPQQRDRGTQ